MSIQKISACLDRLFYLPIAAAAFIHIMIAFLRHFLPLNGLLPMDYLPGAAAFIISVFLIIITVFISIINRKNLLHFRVDYLFTISIMVLYVISCRVISRQMEGDYLYYNRTLLYDTFVTLLFVFPLGHFAGRCRDQKWLRLFLNVLLLAVTALMLFVFFQAFRGRVIDLPSGSQIRMVLTNSKVDDIYRLEVACNANTTGLDESLAFLIAVILLFWNTTVPGKIFALCASLVHMTGLILSGSRTALYATVLGAVLMILVYFFKQGAAAPRSVKIRNSLVCIAVFLVVFFLMKTVVIHVSQSVNLRRNAEEGASTGSVPAIAVASVSSENPASRISLAGAAPSVELPGKAVSAGVSLDLSTRSTSRPVLVSFRQAQVGAAVLTAENSEKTENTEKAGSADNKDKETHGVLYKTLNSLLSDRLRIWEYAFKAITSSPQRILTGVTPVNVNDALNEASGRELNYYTHNQFFELALCLGIPALLIFVLFLFWTLRSCILLFLDPSSSAVTLLATVFLAIILLSNVTEATLLFYRFLSSYVFFFLCGWINEQGGKAAKNLRKNRKTSAKR